MRFLADGIDFPDELLRAHDEGRTVFFCGAGVSRAKAGLPDFAQLTEEVLDHLGAPPDNKARLFHTASGKIETDYGIKGLTTSDRVFGQLRRDFTDDLIGEAVANSLRPIEPVDFSAHRTVLKLATLQTGELRLITTNFDFLFEQAGGRRLKYATRSNLPHVEFNEADWGVVHLHGMVNSDYSGPENDGFVLSSAELGDAYLALGWARDFVRKILDRYVAVFLGYSADDPPIRYLLEGLQQSKGLKNKAYAFQSIPDDEAVAAWDEKGVTAITFRTDDDVGYDRLWLSLDAWTQRSKDPQKWRQSILQKAKKGPRSLEAHERGMVAHIVSYEDGAKAFSSFRPSLPSEWLCVFDPYVRFGEPRSIAGRFSGGPIVDPHPRYRLDCDASPRAPDDHSPRRGRMPEEAWNGLEPSPNDLKSIQLNQVSFLRGYYAEHLPVLPIRISHLASWIAMVAHEPACTWWAGQQNALHPDILSRLRIDFDTQTSANTTQPVADSWRTIREYHALKGEDRDLSYELKLRAKATGWHEPLAREYASYFAPYLQLQSVWRSPIPPDGRRKLRERDLVQVAVEYFEGIRSVEVPDDYLAPLIGKLRDALHLASDLETRYSYDIDICSIEPDERGEDEGDDDFHRQYKLSGHVLHFVGLFRRYAVLHPIEASGELRSWTTSETIFGRLKVWGMGLLDLVPANEFALLVCSLDDESFWPFKGNRDLLLGLARRWVEFSDADRSEIGRRILKGPTKRKKETRTAYKERMAYIVLNRLHWLASQGCAFDFDLTAKTERLQQSAPEWKPEYALKAARSLDGGGGWVRTETSFDEIKSLSAEDIIPHILSMDRRPVGRLVEYNPFLGLSTDQPECALEALDAHAASEDEFQPSFWNTFLRTDIRKDDDSSLLAQIAQSLLKLPNQRLAQIALSASDWFEKHGEALKDQDFSLFDELWNRLTLALVEEESTQRSTLVREEEEPDWSTEAINSPAGNLAEFLLSHTLKKTFEKGEGLPDQWRLKAEQLLSLPGDSRRFALVLFGYGLRFFYYVDPEWTEEKLLAVLDTNYEPEIDGDALWAGFFWRAQTPSAELFARLKPKLVERLQGRPTQKRQHMEVLSGILLAGWHSKDESSGERLVSSSELRTFLLQGSAEYRRHTLWTLDRWAEDGNEWSASVPEFLRDVWPKQKSIRTKDISARLVELALSQKANFPEVAKLVTGLVSRVDDDRIFIPELRKSEDSIALQHPDELLDLLYAVLPESVSLWPYGTQAALERIGEAKPSLRSSAKFIELSARMG
ncbi:MULTISPECIES: SIR2 family protein [Hyphomonas]|jgi:SIR2-like domain|uniref:Uncharacterized protein n=1 Tax=Hyphomonas chukchiensis TaxID=1280947 RepID=A0A062U7Y0_9PROT|nr:SIR2 family protein [Hyphomonas chukchiensis]KCZ56461.1 hypothetical protein HY30_18580 [Hyphomonas chukchiensis]|tara:strand:- start:481 stop:4314 length:3834 start_codon:yes stop_codon:yes gene_type:complete